MNWNYSNTWSNKHGDIIALPSLLDLTSFHGNGFRGTGVGTLDVVFVIRHGLLGSLGISAGYGASDIVA